MLGDHDPLAAGDIGEVDRARRRLQLSHRTLGEIVGARHQTVTTALGRLREMNKLRPVDGGRWLLLGDPPAVFEAETHGLD